MFHQLLLAAAAVIVSSQTPLPALTEKLQDMKKLTCIKASDPAAVNATQLYGSHDDWGYLWTRDSTSSAPLPPCSSSSFSPRPSHCEVCLHQEEVYMICDNLPAGAALHLENPPKAFISRETGCPVLPTAAAGSTSVKIITVTHQSCPDENRRNRLAAFASAILLVSFIIILTVTGLCRTRSSQKKNQNLELPI